LFPKILSKSLTKVILVIECLPHGWRRRGTSGGWQIGRRSL